MFENLIKVNYNDKLSIEFIRENKDKLNWKLICRYQDITLDFIEEFKDYIDIDEILLRGELYEIPKWIEEYSINHGVKLSNKYVPTSIYDYH